MNATKTSFNNICEAAKRGDWAYVDAHINEHLAMENVTWALDVGLQDSDQNIRDLAATILDEAEGSMGHGIADDLEVQMKSDPHHIVRFRLAIALWKSGRRNGAVKAMMDQALVDPDVSAVAVKWFD